MGAKVGVRARAIAVIAALLLIAGCGSRSWPVSSAGPGATDEEPGATATGATVVDDLGVAEVAAPDPTAEVVGTNGVPMAGDQLLVTLADGAGKDEAEAVAAAVGGRVVGQIEYINLWQLAIPPTSAQGVEAAIDTASRLPGVEAAFPNETIEPAEDVEGVRQTPFDKPPYDGLDGLGYDIIKVDTAWRYLQASGLPRHPVHVGIIDAGIWTGNGEFSRVSLHQPDPSSGLLTVPPDKFGGHGTEVANLVAADPHNGGVTGIAGIVDQLTVSTTNAFEPPYGSPGRGSVTGGLKAIVGQVRAGARVINLSWGRIKGSPSGADAYRRFFERMADRHPDVLFVAIAHNQGQVVDGSRAYPGGQVRSNMITVGNVMNDCTTAPSSNRASPNFEVTLAAPGQEAVRAVGADHTVFNTLGGTSMAAPQVTAAAALLLSIKPGLNAAQIKSLLTENARKSCGVQAVDTGVGGRVLAIDLAVRKLIDQERGDRQLTPAKLSDLEFDRLSRVDAVAVSSESGRWTVKATIPACHPGCTDVTIKTDAAVEGAVSQHLGSAGEVTWTTTPASYPTEVLVTRTDNGAATVVTLEKAPTAGLDGKYTGTETVTAVAKVAGCADVGTVNKITIEIATDPSGTGTAYWTYYLTEDRPTSWTDPLTWTVTQGTTQVVIRDEQAGATYGEWVGIVTQVGNSTTITGTFTTNSQAAGACNASGTWTVTRTQ